MTYLQFLLIFIVAPTCVLLYATMRKRPHARVYGYVAGLSVVAFLYATPWDNYLVKNEIWAYGIDRVVGTIGYVPIEEYMFFVLQTFFTGLWTVVLYHAKKWPVKSAPRLPWLELSLYVILGVAGVAAFFVEPGRYFALIAAWASPICIFQWWWAPRYLAGRRSLLAAAIFPPSLYLWVADWYAIREGIWTITDATRSGWELAGLPVEEALFFFVTNVMVVQGLVLLLRFGDSRAK